MTSHNRLAPFEVLNPNKPWVAKELEKLIREWRTWNGTAQGLEPTNARASETCDEALIDGTTNLEKHEILREKTLVFLRNNLLGFEFAFDNWPSHPHEDKTSRLKRRVPRWLHRLEMIQACLEYARVPDGFWKEKGKNLIDALATSTPEKAIDIASSYLKNPLST